MSTTIYDAVPRFIDRFTDHGRKQEVIDTFSNGCCYWFAKILTERFRNDTPYCWLVYDDVANHWGAQIDGRVYDITGDVSYLYNWRKWDIVMWEDELLTERLFRDCILF